MTEVKLIPTEEELKEIVDREQSKNNDTSSYDCMSNINDLHRTINDQYTYIKSLIKDNENFSEKLRKVKEELVVSEQDFKNEQRNLHSALSSRHEDVVHEAFTYRITDLEMQKLQIKKELLRTKLERHSFLIDYGRNQIYLCYLSLKKRNEIKPPVEEPKVDLVSEFDRIKKSFDEVKNNKSPVDLDALVNVGIEFARLEKLFNEIVKNNKN